MAKHGEFDPKAHKLGKVELCTFTVALKRELFPKLRRQFEAPQSCIPVSRAIREDLHMDAAGHQQRRIQLLVT